MTCKKYTDERILFAYGESDDAAFVEHLKTCSDCQVEVAAYKTAQMGTRSLAEAPAPSLSNDRLRQAILSAELKPQLSPWFLRLGTAGASAAAIVAVWLVMGKGLENTVAPSIVEKPGPPIASKPIEKHSDLKVAVPSASNAVAAQASLPKRHRSRRANVMRAQMPDLVAVAGDGVTQAVEVFAEAPQTPSGNAASKKDAGVILIQPDGSGANERSSNDVAIGG